MLRGSSSLPSRDTTRCAFPRRRGKKKGDLSGSPFFGSVRRQQSAGLLDPVTLQALGADPDPLGRAVYQDAYRLQVGVPAPLGTVISVTDAVAGYRPFGAHGAYPCHTLHP